MKDIAKIRLEIRNSRKKRIRQKISGTSNRPRLSVRRSLKHIYAQLIDDSLGVTLLACSSQEKDLEGELKGKTKREQAEVVGKHIADKMKEKKIDTITFDRSGYFYHGRVKALSESVRDEGIKF